MKKLQLGFKTEEGKSKNLSLTYFKDDLKEEDIKSAMKKMSDSKLFAKNGQEIYHQPVSAKYVTRTEETIFEEVPVV